jgi:hypothetical protein
VNHKKKGRILVLFVIFEKRANNADTDESTHSFILALNDEYNGGGTYFYQSQSTVSLKTSDVLSFRGDSIEHGGEAITKGSRYIIVAFLYCETEKIESTSRDIYPLSLASKRLLEDNDIGQSKQPGTKFAFSFLP